MLWNFLRASILASLLAFVFSVAPALAQSGTEPNDIAPTITVSGEAAVRVIPDQVIFRLGIQTQDKDLIAAKNENDARVKRVLELAQATGISAKDIQSDFLQIDPRYSDSYVQSEVAGYVVRKSLVITLRDLNKFEDFLTKALQAGVTHVHGIDFRTSDLKTYREQARALALQAAQDKANKMASALGRKAGTAQRVVEEQNYWYSWYGSWWGGAGYQTQNVIQNANPGVSPELGDDATAPGQISVSARVTVAFLLE